MTRESIRPWALAAGRRGFAVFPLQPWSKLPRKGLPWADVATADPARLEAARWHEGENYGVAAKLCGLVILDVDTPKNGYELPARWRHWQDEPGIRDGWDVLAALTERAGAGRWTATFTVKTPTGGAHLYYRAPSGRNIGNKPLGPMIDVRAAGGEGGGYVVGAGSVLDERAYPGDPAKAAMVRGGKAYEIADDQDPQPLPGWVADLLDPPQTAPAPRRARVTRPTVVTDSTYKRMLGLVQYVMDRQAGDRNAPLYWAACRAAELVADGEVARDAAEDALTEAALRAGLRGGEAEARRTINSGFRKGAA